MRKKWLLHDKWKVKLGNESADRITNEFNIAAVQDWFPASVPGTIHTDLLNANKIKDPFFSDNEKSLKWIAESNWVYQVGFDLTAEMNRENLFLVFDGLDTVSEVELNGQVVGQTNNMFRRYRFPISKILRDSRNQLQVRFKSPMNIGRDLLHQYGEIFSARNKERTYLRKAQYSFGWDWGPAFPTVGIWRPVYLEQLDQAWIQSVRFDTLELDDSFAKVVIKIDLKTQSDGDYEIKCDLSLKDKQISQLKSVSIKSGSDATNRDTSEGNSNIIEIPLEVKDPSAWWPNGHGDQPLYDLKVTLSNSDELLDQAERKIGIRIVELVLQEDAKQTFYFKINGKPVYLKGANWIPADSFIPRISESKYQKIVTMARDAGMNILRIWGGGIYEQPDFYELCDQLGVLIWQDFMFACSSYPENDFFMENVRKEAREIVTKLQYHPSIIIWCGNNENEWIWYRENLGSYKTMPGYSLFHHELKEISQELDPNRPYWPTTPFGLEEDPNSVKSGNRHAWEIWSGWIDYQNVKNDKSLFVSEFGFQGPANIDTLNSVIKEENRYIQDEIFEFHNKQIEGNERLIRFLAGHLPLMTNWEDFIYLTQLNQGFALKTCLEHWRNRWPKTAGSIIWQLNDCWPVTSWSLVDSELNPKISYFFIKSIFSDPTILIRDSEAGITATVVNESSEEFKGLLEYSIIDLLKNQFVKSETNMVSLKQDEKQQVIKIKTKDLTQSGNLIFITSLRDEQNYIIDRNYFIPKKWKHLKAPASAIQISRDVANKLILTSEKPALFVDLYYKGVRFSDRGFILLPGEKKELEIIADDPGNLRIEDIKVFTLNDYLRR